MTSGTIQRYESLEDLVKPLQSDSLETLNYQLKRFIQIPYLRVLISEPHPDTVPTCTGIWDVVIDAKRCLVERAETLLSA